MKWKFAKSYEPFYFQARQSLNIPIPTPASDRGGPVACIDGPVGHPIGYPVGAPGRGGHGFIGRFSSKCAKIAINSI